jgi:hypothetical protein
LGSAAAGSLLPRVILRPPFLRRLAPLHVRPVPPLIRPSSALVRPGFDLLGRGGWATVFEIRRGLSAEGLWRPKPRRAAAVVWPARRRPEPRLAAVMVWLEAKVNGEEDQDRCFFPF